MLLCVDVGNSNITFGIYKDKELIETFRMETKEITSLNQLSEQFSIITNTYSYLLNDFDYVIIDSTINFEAINAGLLNENFDKSHILRAGSLSQAVMVLNTLAQTEDVVLFENDLPDSYS